MYLNAFTLPRDVNTGNVAIPNVAPGVVASVNAELGELTVTNTTASNVTLTVTDNAASPQYVLDAVNIPPGAPTILIWNPPLPCASGIQWQASASGLVGCILGRRETGWTLTNGYATSTSA